MNTYDALTDGSFVAERMEHIVRVGVPLFAPPNEVDPLREVLADVVTFQRSPMHDDEK